MFTDRTVLTEAYAARGPLAARASIYQWQRDRLDLASFAVDALVDVRGTVLDAGCGPGTYVQRLQRARPDLGVLALDLSAGMQPDVVGDVQALPLADASVGAGLAMHMLYHVPDIPMAIRELRRVIRPGGILVISTNGIDDNREIGQLFVNAARDLTGISIEVPDADDRFTPDDAPLLRHHFDSVKVDVYERETLVPKRNPSSPTSTACARCKAGACLRRELGCVPRRRQVPRDRRDRNRWLLAHAQSGRHPRLPVSRKPTKSAGPRPTASVRQVRAGVTVRTTHRV